jgi:hypothetical protein
MEKEATGPRKGRGRRFAVAAAAVLGAFGVLSAIGTHVVDGLWSEGSGLNAGDEALKVSVRDAVGGNDGFSMATWAPDPAPKRVAAVSGCESLFGVAKALGAARIGKSILDLVVEGSAEHEVTIVDLRPEIVVRKKPVHGAQFRCASAGAVEAIGFEFDFNEPHPVVREVGHGEGRGSPYFSDGDTIVLKQGEVQPIQITAIAAEGAYVAWNLVVEAVVDSKIETFTVDEHGRPFQLTPDLPANSFDRYYEWLWFETPQRLYRSHKPFEYRG